MSKTKVGRKIYNFSAACKNWFKRKVIQSNIFIDMGFAYIGPVDGHDFKSLDKAFSRAKSVKKSVIVHVTTLKGKGYNLSEQDTTGYWHGVSPFNIETGEPLNLHKGMVSWSHIFSDLTSSMLEKHNDAILIAPATQKGAGMDVLFNKFPNRTIDVGIAEEHAATMASGLALAGKHPIISIYSTFMQRAYDEISHDIARLNANVTFLVDRSGLVGADGETHQGIYDEAYLSSIPNVTVTMPSNPDEALALYEQSFDNHGPFFIRLPRCLVEKQEIKVLTLDYGKWLKLAEDKSKSLAIIGVGPLFRELEEKLKTTNVKATLVNAIYLNPVDKILIESLLDYKKIIIYDPYSTQGGLVNFVMAELLTKGYKGAIKAYFVPNEFVKQASVDEQLSQYRLLPEQIIEDLK